MMKYYYQQGQSTLEFILLVTGVISFLILFLGPSGLFRRSYQDTLVQATSGMEDMANRYNDSLNPTAPATPVGPPPPPVGIRP